MQDTAKNRKNVRNRFSRKSCSISFTMCFNLFTKIQYMFLRNVLDFCCLEIRHQIKYSDNSDQTVVNQKCIRNHTIDLSLARTHTPKAINEKWLKFGDLLINSTGDGTLGRVAQVWFAPKALTVDSHVTIVRPAREELIFYIGLWGILHEKEIESLHTGSTGQTELPRDRVKMLKLLLPDNISLSRFNSIITPMASTIISNQEENQKLASLRDTLLPKLMSGEIDVSNIQF